MVALKCSSDVKMAGVRSGHRSRRASVESRWASGESGVGCKLIDRGIGVGGAGRGGAGRLGIGMVNGQERADHLGTSHEAGAMMARGSGWLGHRLGELVVKMMMNGAA